MTHEELHVRPVIVTVYTNFRSILQERLDIAVIPTRSEDLNDTSRLPSDPLKSIQ